MKLFKKSQELTRVTPPDCNNVSEELYQSVLTSFDMTDMDPLIDELKYTRVAESLQNNVMRSLEIMIQELAVVEGVLKIATERKRQLDLSIEVLTTARDSLVDDTSVQYRGEEVDPA